MQKIGSIAMVRILGMDIATLDIINTVEDYPQEDAEIRACAQSQRRGGNATNTLVVLGQLGHHCNWVGTGQADGRVSTSYVTLNRRSGSRTIVHYRELDEYPFEAFRDTDLTPFQ
jgi:ketohexokinase